MLVLNTTSPNVSPAAPNARPVYTVPSSSASFAMGDTTAPMVTINSTSSRHSVEGPLGLPCQPRRRIALGGRFQQLLRLGGAGLLQDHDATRREQDFGRRSYVGQPRVKVSQALRPFR